MYIMCCVHFANFAFLKYKPGGRKHQPGTTAYSSLPSFFSPRKYFHLLKNYES